MYLMFHQGDIRLELLRLCGAAFSDIIKLLSPTRIVSVGRFVEARVNAALKQTHISTSHLCMAHPSPRSLNNTDWSAKTAVFLRDNGVFV